MPNASHCTRCGAVLAPFGADALCPKCMVGEALGLATNAEDGTGATQVAAPTEGIGTRIGSYKLLQPLGQGGMGTVWMAEQTEPVRRMVALKLIKPGMDSANVLARFEAERQALALMDHPNIAKVLEAGTSPSGRPYFVMELVKGIPMITFCDERRLSIRERLELFLPVCQAIQHAHQKGVIHRDIKPSNVLVALYDGAPVPKVIDFGIAKATGQPLTQRTLFTEFGALIGTPEYMSPEQAELNQLDIDTRSDIYSLGVLLYELLTGTTPLQRETLRQAAFDEVLRRIREEEPPKPSTRLTDSKERLAAISAQRKLDPAHLMKLVRGDLDWIVMKALEKDRSRRYDTANGLALDVQRHLHDEPVLAGPPTVRYRLRKFARKHRAAAVVAAGFVLLLTVATGVSTWLAVWANRERANAVKSEGAADLARQEAQQEAGRRLATLTEMQIQRAEDYFTADDSPRALAYLASVLTSDPSNRVAAERLLSALTLRSFCLPLVEPLRHEGFVYSAQFSSDGLRVVTASADKTARVWDARTGKPLTEALRHEGRVYSAQFSPDGLRVVTASEDNAARVWDAQSGTPLTEALRHKRIVYSAQFSPDGLRVVTASEDNTARVWDARSGKPLTELLRHETSAQYSEPSVHSAQFSPDGLRLVTASHDRTARVWDAQSGKALTDALRHHVSVRSAQFSPDGLRVITASYDPVARVWDAQTGKLLSELLRHERGVHSAQFSPDGLRAVTASDDNTAQVWDARTGKPLTGALRHEGTVYSAQFSPDGLRVVTASSDNTARVWDAQTGKPLTEALRHEGSVHSAQFSPDGLRVVTASSDNTARVWDAQSGMSLSTLLRHREAVRSVQFSPDGLRVITAYDKTARLWDAQTGKPLAKPLRHEDDVPSAQFSADGLRVVTASEKMARVWDAQTGEPLTEPFLYRTQLKAAVQLEARSERNLTESSASPSLPISVRIIEDHGSQPQMQMRSAQFSPDGLRVVTASDKTARVWDAQTGKPLTAPLLHEGWIYAGQFSPDGLRVVTASEDKTARVWDAQTGKPLTEPLRHEEAVRSAQFSSNGLQVVTASSDKTARVWDAQTGKPLTKPFLHEDKVASAQFSPEGLRVVTASADKTARVWDTQTGKPLTEPLRHEEGVLFAQFSPDGLRVVTASADKTARVWDAQTGKPLTEPIRHEDSVASARISPDGRRVVTASDKTARVWEMAVGSVPAPPWLSQLAVTVAAKRLTEAAVFEPVAAEEFLKLKEQLSMVPTTNFYTLWAKWFFADRATRTISPLSSITVPEYVRRRIEENREESLSESLLLSPTNALAWARLGIAVLRRDGTNDLSRNVEAEWCAKRASSLSPRDAEVVKAVAEIRRKQGLP